MENPVRHFFDIDLPDDYSPKSFSRVRYGRHKGRYMVNLRNWRKYSRFAMEMAQLKNFSHRDAFEYYANGPNTPLGFLPFCINEVGVDRMTDHLARIKLNGSMHIGIRAYPLLMVSAHGMSGNASKDKALWYITGPNSGDNQVGKLFYRMCDFILQVNDLQEPYPPKTTSFRQCMETIDLFKVSVVKMLVDPEREFFMQLFHKVLS